MNSATRSTPQEFAPRICIVGPGRVGRTLALHHHRLNHSVLLLGRRPGEWQDWASANFIPHGIVDWENCPLTEFDILLFCVDDRSLPSAVKDCLPWTDQITKPILIAHTSGHLALQVFELESKPANSPHAGIDPLPTQQPTRGVAISFAALHPAQPFADPNAPLPVGIPVTAITTGNTQMAQSLVQSWNARWIPLPADVDRDRYHLAVSLAANHVTEILGRSEQLLHQAWPGESSELRAVISHLAQSAVTAYSTHGAEQALTGPIVRGDLPTLQAHYAKLPADLRLVQLHDWLAVCDLARRSGRLAGDRADEIRKWLSEQLSSATSV
jgi:hypothetical protein